MAAMALDPTELLRTEPEDYDLPVAPLGGTRSQSIQRLQIGLSGLAAMVLLVGLANIIMDNAQQNQASVVPEAVSTMAEAPAAEPASDPLADAGVVPDLPAQPAPPVVVIPPPVNVEGRDGAAQLRP